MTDNIFVTVGAQMAFDRLVHTVDRWAAATDRDVDVFAQIGPTDAPPSHVAHAVSMGPEDFSDRLDWADVVVAHAGMGTIISALVIGKPIVVLARSGAMKETRNDHQVATVDRFANRHGVTVVRDESDLLAVLEGGSWIAPDKIATDASSQLIETIRDFVNA